MSGMIGMKLRVLVSALVCASGVCAAVVVVPAVSARTSHTRPALIVAKGSIAQGPTGLHGSFTIVDQTPAGKVGRSKAKLGIVASGATALLATYRVPKLRAGHHKKINVKGLAIPATLPAGPAQIVACAQAGRRFNPTAKSCAVVGSLTVPTKVHPVPVPTPTTTTPAPAPPTTTTTTTTTPTTTTPTTTLPPPPTGYANLTPDTPTFYADGLGQYNGAANNANSNFTSGYWMFVPTTYSNQTPETLLVWLHGCGGTAQDDMYNLTTDTSTNATYNRPFVMIALQGPDAGYDSATMSDYPGPDCWNTDDNDVSKIIQVDIRDAEIQFNIDPRRIILGGYSSGGDLAYRTIWEHSTDFAGILAQNTNPFRDTNLTQSQALADDDNGGWKFNDIHVATTDDDEYHLDACTGCLDNGGDDPGVQPAITAMNNDGFTATLEITGGGHYAPDSCLDDNTNTNCYGTYYDINDHLLNTIGTDGWKSPAP